MAAERLQKILASGGLGSRRGTEQLITEGRVRVNGKVVTELGSKADPRVDKIEVDGKRVIRDQPIYVALHKPRGFVTTLSDPEGRPTIRDLLKPHGLPARVFPVGRLDYNTSGILLLTNDGEFSDGMLHPRRAVPKTYVVKVDGLMEAKDLDRWREGVQLEDGRTLPAEAFVLRHEQGKTWFQITIREGRNNQIRRMGDATGFRVMRLARISFAGITSEDIKPGDLRPLTYEELVDLKKDYGVPRKPNVGKEGIKGWEHKPRAGVAARRSGGNRERKRPAEDTRAPVGAGNRDRKRPAVDERAATSTKGSRERQRPGTAAPPGRGNRDRKRPATEDIFADQPDAVRGPRGRRGVPAPKKRPRVR